MQEFMSEELYVNIIENIREKAPLVHCITNYVTAGDVANVLLACGASPIMADDIAEVHEITVISDALVINMGTLSQRTVGSMIKAGEMANKKGIPVVLDPVGVGGSTFRNETVKELLDRIKFAVIKGNLSELSFLAGLGSNTRGVDSSASDNKNNTFQVAALVSERYHVVAVVTGTTDVVTHGSQMAEIQNGTGLMRKVTGTGCMLSGMIGAYIAVNTDIFPAVIQAVSAMGIAGEIASEGETEMGMGSFHMALIDAVGRMEDKTLRSRGKICVREWKDTFFVS